MASITIKTPKHSINLKASEQEKSIFADEIERSAAKMCIGALSKNYQKAYEDQLVIIATFFQRLVARTPVDENYDRVVLTKKGDTRVVHHTPDEEVCREHWFIEDTRTGRKLYSKSLFDSEMSFNVVNNSEEISKIKEAIRAICPISNGLPSFAVGNDCKHFESIEYGYNLWKSDSEPVTGDDIGREHGVKNKHSVQAPVGMLRITEAELQSIRKRPSLRSLRSRYKGGLRTSVTPSDKKLKEFYEILKKSHSVRYADIKRFLEVY